MRSAYRELHYGRETSKRAEAVVLVRSIPQAGIRIYMDLQLYQVLRGGGAPLRAMLRWGQIWGNAVYYVSWLPVTRRRTRGSGLHCPPRSTTKFITTAILMLSFIPPTNAANDSHDFADNLFTDLAPILALFGEQVTKQFLSESTGWADNILFAMAPLGVITGVVSAIRVAGPTWLRALVGRGKEGLAQTELELMSSNSSDVGEMWNGQAIVRVLGTPCIFQLIYAQDSVQSSDIEPELRTIGILNDDNHFFKRQTPRKTVGNSNDRGAWNDIPDIEMRPLLPNQTDGITVNQNDHSKCPPNISLNARGEPIGKTEKWLMAAIGVIAQSVVLIYHYLICFYPPWRNAFLEDGDQPSMEAFPCAVMGTVCLNIGMLICSYVIDCASVEERWILKDSSQGCKVAWVQQGGTVNDQMFDPYIIFGHDGQKEIITSHRCHLGRERQLRFWVLVGTFASMAGFVTQFVGLRGMHWSASVAQLAATCFLTAIRAFVRRHITRQPIASRAVEGFELDCMAREMKDCFALKVFSDISSAPVDPGDDYLQDVVLNRKLLGELSGWTSEVDDVAHAVCAAIEKTLNYLYESKEIRLSDTVKQLTEISWDLAALALEKKQSGTSPSHHYGHISFSLVRSRGGWSITEHTKGLITSILSLWRLCLSEEESYNRTGCIFPEKSDLMDVHQIAKIMDGKSDLEILNGGPQDISESMGIPNHWFLGNLKVDKGFYPGSTVVVLFPEASVKSALAQEVFSAFFSSIVPYIERISGNASLVRYEHGVQELRHNALSRLVEIVSETGIGSRQEILMHIITHLGKQELLPVAGGLESTAAKHARIERAIRSSRRANRWDHCAAQIKEIFENKGTRVDISWLEEWTAHAASKRFCTRVRDLYKGMKQGYISSESPRTHFQQWLESVDVKTLALLSTDDATGSEIDSDGGDERKVELLLAPFKSSGSGLGRLQHSAFEEPSFWGWSFDGLGSAITVEEVVERGLHSLMEALIDSNPYILDSGGSGYLLGIAISRGHAPIVQQILNQMYLYEPESYLRFQTGDQQALLWNALKLPDESTARILLGHTPIDHLATYSPATLVLAANSGHYGIVQELHEDELDIDAHLGSNHGKMWLLATSGYHDRATRYFWDAPSISFWGGYGRNKHSKALLSTGGGYQSFVKHFLDNGDMKEAAAAISVRTALQLVAEEGKVSFVEQLLEASANMNSEPRGLFWRSALQTAAGNGHLEVVQILHKKGANINQRAWGVSGRTALQAAAEGGYLKVVDWLLENEADVNAEPAELYGRTALQAAASAGYLEVVNLLLERNANVDAWPSASQGLTALQAAAFGGHLEVVNRLLEYHARVNAKPSICNGLTALQAAALGGHVEVFELLLEHDADVNAECSTYHGVTALQAASLSGHLVVVNRLLEHGARVKADPSTSHGLTALQAAALEGHVEVVHRLLACGANVNAEPSGFHGLTALQAAALEGHLTVVDQLLGDHAEVNVDPAGSHGLTALQAASLKGHLEVVNRLLEQNVHVNAHPSPSHGLTALQAAALGGHLAVVDRLLEHHASVNSHPSTSHGLTALQAAALRGHLVVVDRLLEHNAKVNADHSASYGLTALQAAALGGHLPVVNRLLEQHATVDHSPSASHGLTALQAASLAGHLTIVGRLLEYHASINADPSPSYGLTALQAAALQGHLVVVRRLLDQGAEVNAEPSASHGFTALQAAAFGGHLTIVNLFLKIIKTYGEAIESNMVRAALQPAAEMGHLAIVTRLLDEKADVNASPSKTSGRTALQAAAEGGYLDVVDLLIKNDADVNAGGTDLTALQAAAKGGHLEVVNRLLDESADINASPLHSEGKTALEAASKEGHMDVVKRLLEAGADVSTDGMFLAVQAAKRAGYLEIVDILSSHGIDSKSSTVASSSGEALNEGYEEITDPLFQDNGGPRFEILTTRVPRASKFPDLPPKTATW